MNRTAGKWDKHHAHTITVGENIILSVFLVHTDRSNKANNMDIVVENL